MLLQDLVGDQTHALGKTPTQSAQREKGFVWSDALLSSSPPPLSQVQPIPRMASLTGSAERTFLDQILQIAGCGCA